MLTKDIFSFEQLGPNIQFKPTKYLNPNVLKVGSVTIYGPQLGIVFMIADGHNLSVNC